MFLLTLSVRILLIIINRTEWPLQRNTEIYSVSDMSSCLSLSRMVYQIISTYSERTWRLLKRIKSHLGCDSVGFTFLRYVEKFLHDCVWRHGTVTTMRTSNMATTLSCLGTIVIHFHNTFVTKSTIALYGCRWTSSWSTNQRGAPVVTVSVEHYFLKKSTKYKAVKRRWSPSSESLRFRKLSKVEEWPCLCGTSLLLEGASKQAGLQNLRLSIFSL